MDGDFRLFCCFTPFKAGTFFMGSDSRLALDLGFLSFESLSLERPLDAVASEVSQPGKAG